jgi:hypothetical protein
LKSWWRFSNARKGLARAAGESQTEGEGSEARESSAYLTFPRMILPLCTPNNPLLPLAAWSPRPDNPTITSKR